MVPTDPIMTPPVETPRPTVTDVAFITVSIAAVPWMLTVPRFITMRPPTFAGLATVIDLAPSTITPPLIFKDPPKLSAAAFVTETLPKIVTVPAVVNDEPVPTVTEPETEVLSVQDAPFGTETSLVIGFGLLKVPVQVTCAWTEAAMRERRRTGRKRFMLLMGSGDVCVARQIADENEQSGRTSNYKKVISITVRGLCCAFYAQR